MNYLKLKEVTKNIKNVMFNDIVIGEIVLDIDGSWYYENTRPGLMQSWVLREIADILDQENKDFENGIIQYFKKNPPGKDDYPDILF